MNTFFSAVAGCRVRWQAVAGKGDPLFFIHGLGCASSYDYLSVVTAPQFSGHRAVLVDLPGYGYSDKPEQFSYSISEQAQVMAELITHCAIEKCFLFGHSMGGSISIELAELLGDKLSGIIVAEPNTRPGGGRLSREVCSMTEEEFIRSGYQQMIAAESSPWAGSLAISSPRAVWRSAASLIAGKQWLDALIALPVRKQIVFGEYSLPSEDMDKAVRSQLPYHVLKECGHFMAYEDPHTLAQVLSAFLSL